METVTTQIQDSEQEVPASKAKRNGIKILVMIMIPVLLLFCAMGTVVFVKAGKTAETNETITDAKKTYDTLVAQIEGLHLKLAAFNPNEITDTTSIKMEILDIEATLGQIEKTADEFENSTQKLDYKQTEILKSRQKAMQRKVDDYIMFEESYTNEIKLSLEVLNKSESYSKTINTISFTTGTSFETIAAQLDTIRNEVVKDKSEIVTLSKFDALNKVHTEFFSTVEDFLSEFKAGIQKLDVAQINASGVKFESRLNNAANSLKEFTNVMKSEEKKYIEAVLAAETDVKKEYSTLGF